MDSAFTGRSSCPACGYPVKYRWMGHGNGDLMVNPDGTPHKDSCPANAFRELRKRAMKSPRGARQYNGSHSSEPQLTQRAPGETPTQILEQLLQNPLPNLGRANGDGAESEMINGAVAGEGPHGTEDDLPGFAHVRRGKKLELTDQPKRRRGRPRRKPVVVARPEKPKKPQREIVRCPACVVPLITDLNTGAQVCLTCDFQLAPPQAASGT